MVEWPGRCMQVPSAGSCRRRNLLHAGASAASSAASGSSATPALPSEGPPPIEASGAGS